MFNLVVKLALVGTVHVSALPSSPCIGEGLPKKGVALARIQEGATWFQSSSGEAAVPVEVEKQLTPEERVVCVDSALQVKGASRTAVVAVRAQMARVFFVEANVLSSVKRDARSWAHYRTSLDDQSGQTGCLRPFDPGTVLYDRPEGTVVAVVVSRTQLGKWESASGASGHWAKVRGGVLATSAWVRVPSGGDWCAE